MEINKYRVAGLSGLADIETLKTKIGGLEFVAQVDVNLEKMIARVISQAPISLEVLNAALQGTSLRLEELPSEQTVRVSISGMTCTSCELLVEESWRNLPGVTSVEVSSKTGQACLRCADRAPKISELQAALGDSHYQIRAPDQGAVVTAQSRISFEKLGLFTIVILFLGWVFSSFGFLSKFSLNVAGATLGGIFVMGLIASASTCLAVTSGLLLSSAARSGRGKSGAIYFILGRVLGYAIFGGLLALLGKVLTPSPTVTSILLIAAAVYLLVTGLEMLGLAPKLISQLLPKMPKSLGRLAMSDKVQTA
ncbi:MAG: cation transporter, partial [bacterium]